MPDRYGRYEPQGRDWLGRERYDTDRAREDDPLEDYGQADFSTDYRYDPETRTGYRVDPKEQARRRADEAIYSDEPDRFADESESVARPRERRSFSLFGDRSDHRAAERRSHDRVLWVVATEALHRARGVDPADIHVRVEHAIITLEGTVRSREEKRRVEALVDQRGVRDVQNNLRIRERRFF